MEACWSLEELLPGRVGLGELRVGVQHVIGKGRSIKEENEGKEK